MAWSLETEPAMITFSPGRQLAGVAAQVGSSPGQDDPQIAVGRLVQGHEHRRRHLLVGLWLRVRGHVE